MKEYILWKIVESFSRERVWSMTSIYLVMVTWDVGLRAAEYCMCYKKTGAPHRLGKDHDAQNNIY
jgi:hypothetical protein